MKSIIEHVCQEALIENHFQNFKDKKANKKLQAFGWKRKKRRTTFVLPIVGLDIGAINSSNSAGSLILHFSGIYKNKHCRFL